MLLRGQEKKCAQTCVTASAGPWYYLYFWSNMNVYASLGPSSTLLITPSYAEIAWCYLRHVLLKVCVARYANSPTETWRD